MSMATKTAIICNVCGFRLDGRVEGFPEEIEWTHPDRECRDFLRERTPELVTALEALLEEVDRDQRSDGWPTPARDEARALLLRLKAP